MTTEPTPRRRASAHRLSVNRSAEPLVEQMAYDADRLGCAVSTGAAGERLIDAGASVPGSLEAGRLLTEICMGGLGDVAIEAGGRLRYHPFQLSVRTSQPVIACLGSQYAGWQLTSEDGGGYFSMGSGPARALAGKETVLDDIAYADRCGQAFLVLETGSPPPEELVRRIAGDCGVAPSDLTILYAPTQSLAGSVQIVGRVVEVALHKAHVLHFDMTRIVSGLGSAPLPPPHPDFVTAMGRTNDAVIYGGRILLHVTGPASDARDLAEALPSRNSKDYGTPFADIFRAYEGDFYKIDPNLFSPAEVAVVALETGETFRAGGIAESLVDASFG
ncbi:MULTISPECIES: methenyltetrahydromethanopterin cyclohydrolase [unclassified Aureimonas]|uniref:methenyltetrahydromethanopterin cyclohydrolase n=1 Tax=unclassified Aureimonas TaxID=2615206 RepID=UPI0006FB4872|nr:MULTISPECIES: methenyltetrahydromethanopterin cyclohydrolase [unclassified Aureimonas]KQT69991.1 methenyltetrahydromethanopterin cyclohydrolase [Aureimonas sp. Leaf427]KQT75853.1 methenyltetrahydromethanopterin cyclohydrolase [Aureimonas sp. Leaf460]